MKQSFLPLVLIIAGFVITNQLSAQSSPTDLDSLLPEDLVVSKSDKTEKQVNLTRIPFQGRLFDDGEPVNGQLAITFSIADIDWDETHDAVMVSEGLYSVDLGSVNPLPQNLFYGVESHSLVINIGETALTPVNVYPPYIGNTFNLEVDPESETYALTATVSGLGDSQTVYYGGRSIAEVGDGRLIGHYGRAVGNNTAYGIYGLGTSSSKYSYGVYGIVNGEGDGSVHDFSGETPVWGSASFGVRGVSTNNLHENIGVAGNAFGVKGVTNKGLLGRSNVNNGEEIDNTGVFAEASGSGINRGVWASAFNGAENWAGWFEGDVKITGNLIVDGEGGGSGGGFELPDNIFMENREHEGVHYGFFQVDATDGAHSFLEPNNFWMHGPESPNVAVEFWGNKNLPKFNLWGNQPNGEGWFHNHIGLWVRDDGDQQYGEFRLWGNNGNENVHFNTRHWEPNNGANRPYMSLTGNEHEHVRMGVGYDGTSGEEFGYFALKGGKGHDIINFGSLHWEGENASNRPFMLMKGNNHEQNLVWLSVNDDGAGGEHAFLSLNNTDGSYSHFRSNGFSINGQSTPNYQFGTHISDEFPHVNLFGNQQDPVEGWFHSHINLRVEEDGTNQWGAIQLMGNEGNPNFHFGAHNANRPFMRMHGDAIDLLELTIEQNDEFNQQAGYLTLRGDNGNANFTVGSKMGEAGGANLPVMHMDGSNHEDGHLVWLSIYPEGEEEFAYLHLNGSNGSHTHFGTNGFSINGKSTPNYQFGTHISDEFPHVNLFGNQQDPVEGWFHSHINLRVEEDGTNQWGAIQLMGNEGNPNFHLGAHEGNRPFLSMVGNVHEHLNMGVSYDETSGEEFGYFNLRGSDGGENIYFGSMHWEGLNAANRPFMTMKGNDQGTNLVWLSVNDDGAGGEQAHLQLNATNGSHTHFGTNGFSINGPSTPNYQFGTHISDEFPNLILFGNQPDGGGWFHRHLTLVVNDDGTNQWGSIELFGNNGNTNFTLGASEGNRPYLSMVGNVHEHLNMGVSYDGTSGEEFGYFALRGSDGGDNIYFGSRHWEGLNAANRPLMRMRGNDQGTDLVWLSIDDDGVGGEHAGIVFRSTNGIETAINHQNINVANSAVGVSGDELGNGVLTINSQGTKQIRMFGNDGVDCSIAVDDGDGINSVHIYGDGRINATGTITCASLVETSDIKLKTNISPLTNSLLNIQKLRGVSFNWADANKSQDSQIGLIAQEVEEVYPEFVHTQDNGIKAVNYSQMAAVLIEAIKELNIKVVQLQEQNLTLQNTLQSQDALIQEVSALKAMVNEILNKENSSDTDSSIEIVGSK